MAKRSWIGRVPIWARVSGIIALVLVGVLAGSMLVGATDNGGGHGTGHQSQTSISGHGTGTHGSGGGGGHSGGGHITATTGR
jgi:hypothetical protein